VDACGTVVVFEGGTRGVLWFCEDVLRLRNAMMFRGSGCISLNIVIPIPVVQGSRMALQLDQRRRLRKRTDP
jgi:hypothetical protein